MNKITTQETTLDLMVQFNWLPIYTAYYLNNKLNYNFNSIKNEVVCIKYKDKYILKEDIIKQFTDLLPDY